MSPQVGVKYTSPRPLGGVLCSLGTLAACPLEEVFIISAEAPWTARPLADQTFGGGSLASEHAPGLSGRHATRSTRQASGYQQAAIYYSWSSEGLQFSRAKPAARTYHALPRQKQVDWSNKRGPREILAARQSTSILRRAAVIGGQLWA